MSNTAYLCKLLGGGGHGPPCPPPYSYGPGDSTCVLKAEPGKLDIKSREPGILFLAVYLLSREPGILFLAVYLLLNTLQTSDYGVFFYFCVD